MVVLCPAPFADLVDRLHLEFERQAAIFDLPRRKWYVPDPQGPDLSVRFHGRPAANPLGPAAGPHTQMAQNLVLAYLAGSRILELKTVQSNDRLTIPRPCIDAANVCYNVEWSQELRLPDSLTQYVAGAMLIHIVRRGRFFEGLDLAGPLGDVIYDLSIGYDLRGIQGRPVVEFVRNMKDAADTIDRLRLQIPARHHALRDMDYPTRLATSITLSTFHGCPAEEIERIVEFILTDLDMDCTVKMNPPMLGKDRLEHLLHDVMGYTEITVSPSAYAHALRFDEALAVCERLDRRAVSLGRHFGVKFSNTLEVLNHRAVFPRGTEVMYMSGPPLHVITLTLADEFRQAIGPRMPISFSAGVDRHNVAGMVACGFCPVTTCTDLLRPGGYARLPHYLRDLARAMARTGARTIADYVLDARGRRHAIGADVFAAAAANLALIADETRRDEHYRAPRHRAVPRRTGSHLALFDCLSCDKCIPTCPNDANFIYRIPPQEIGFHDWLVGPSGALEAGPAHTLRIERDHQIANFADFCNECGNCDTFCPQYGGPFIEKPVFFGSLDSWARHADRDGFYIEALSDGPHILGRIGGRDYQLELNRQTGGYVFTAGRVRATFADPAAPPELEGPIRASFTDPAVPPELEGSVPADHRIDMTAFHTLRLLLHALLDPGRIHHVNAAAVARWERGPGLVCRNGPQGAPHKGALTPFPRPNRARQEAARRPPARPALNQAEPRPQGRGDAGDIALPNTMFRTAPVRKRPWRIRRCSPP